MGVLDGGDVPAMLETPMAVTYFCCGVAPISIPTELTRNGCDSPRQKSINGIGIINQKLKKMENKKTLGTFGKNF